jgi:hypothetical protein
MSVVSWIQTPSNETPLLVQRGAHSMASPNGGRSGDTGILPMFMCETLRPVIVLSMAVLFL